MKREWVWEWVLLGAPSDEVREGKAMTMRRRVAIAEPPVAPRRSTSSLTGRSDA